MKQKSKAVICSLALVSAFSLFSCAPQVINVTPSVASSAASAGKKSRPEWIEQGSHSSPAYFIGVSSAQIDSDLAQAQEQARMRALNDIAQQIEVTIVSDVNSIQKNVTTNAESRDTSVLQENIHELAKASLQDWQVKQTWTAPDGFFWCQVVLEKEKYYARVNKGVNDAIALATDALSASRNGAFADRAAELYKGMTSLDKFLGNVMKATVDGQEVILNSELPRRLRQLFTSVEIRPTILNDSLLSVSTAPDTLGVRVMVEGRPDPSVNLTWTASSQDVALAGMPAREDGLRPVAVKSMPASCGTVTVTASADIGTLGYDLLKRKFTLPSGSFTLSRRSPKIISRDSNDFCRQLIKTLTTRKAAIKADWADEADLVLSAQCVPSGDPVQTMGLYRAKVTLSVLMLTREGQRVLDITEDVGAADPNSAEGARANAEKIAVEKAAKKIEEVY